MATVTVLLPSKESDTELIHSCGDRSVGEGPGQVRGLSPVLVYA
jgi:hypothetical protein